jgi:hypothetical protein
VRVATAAIFLATLEEIRPAEFCVSEYFGVDSSKSCGRISIAALVDFFRQHCDTSCGFFRAQSE